MVITEIRVDGFRNLDSIALKPGPGISVLCGENAQGKTNLLEAVWLCSGEKSFRAAREKDFICFERDKAEINVEFKTSFRTENVSLTLSRNLREKRILLNGVKLRSHSELIGRLLPVIFTPEDLELTKGSPEARRNYVDLCISQIKPMYRRVINKYEKILEQRNAVLKNIIFGSSEKSELDIWDEQLARQGAYISMMRNTYTDILKVHSAELYGDISRKMEKLDICYVSSIYDSLEGRTDYKESMAEEYYNKLVSTRDEDIRLGYTQSGVHRDDISVKINGISVKDFGSQGQNRSCALCLKLGQARALLNETKEMPVILLDDVLSELDKYRKDFVLSQINNAQIFITCCEPIEGMSNIKANGRVYEVKNGRII